MRSIDKKSQQLLVDLFYRIGSLYYGYQFSDHEGRVAYFFMQLRKIQFEIWEKIIKEDKKFEPVSIALPARSGESITLELREDFIINSNTIRGYELSTKKSKFHSLLTLKLFSHLIDPADESKGRTWECSVIFDTDGSNPHRITINKNGSTNEETIAYEKEFIDNVQGFFLTALLIPATIQ